MTIHNPMIYLNKSDLPFVHDLNRFLDLGRALQILSAGDKHALGATLLCASHDLSAYDQVPIQLSQDSVSGLGQKHGATDHAVCAEQHVDGEKTNYSGACTKGEPVAWVNAQEKAQSEHPTGVKSVKWMNRKNGFHLVTFCQSTHAFAGLFRASLN